MHWEQRFRTLAQEQYGLISSFDVAQVGCTREHWRRAQSNGRWVTLSAHVLRSQGAPESDEQRALAGVLDASPGAVLHAETALGWLGMRGFGLREIMVARSRYITGRPVTLAKLHRLRALHVHHVVVVRGVPTQRALRAIWSVAARYGGARRYEIGLRRIGRLLDDAHIAGLVTWSELHEMVEDIHKQGRAGSVIMRALARDRPPGSSPTESRNEDRFEEILRGTAVRPLYRRQTEVGADRPIGRIDFTDDELPLAIEVNSVTFHSSPSDRAADRVRYRSLNRAGFMVGVIWEDDIWRSPRRVIETVVEARRLAKSGTRTVLHSPSCPWPATNAAELPVLGTPAG